MVAHESEFGPIQSLIKRDTRFVLTPDSPSELLASHSGQLQPSRNRRRLVGICGWIQKVLEQLKKSNQTDSKAFILWQPHVAQALQSSGFKVLLDSSQIKRGYDRRRLVARRSFLRDQPDLADTFIEGYFRALYHYQTRAGNGEIDRSRC